MINLNEFKNSHNQKKICFIAPLPPPYGGIANWTKLFTGYLVRNSLADVSIINTAPKGRVTEGRGILKRIFISGFAMFGIESEVRKKIKVEKIECVHIATSGSLASIRDLLVAKLLKNKEIPFIYHIHFGRIPEIIKNNTVEWRLIKKVITLSGYTIVIDKSTQKELVPIFGDKIIYLPNPIDLSSLPNPIEITENTVIYLGWVIKQKGIEELIDSWKSVRDEVKDWKLQIVGPYKQEYINELKEKYSFEKIEFLGEKSHEDAMELLNKASVFVLPSYSEGCPYVIIEAMALKKIILGTSVGNIPEMLSGNCGILFESGNKEELKEKLYQAIIQKDKFEKTKELAYEKIIKEYTIDIIANKILSLIERLTEKRC
ncbi:MAG: glycosyltransferase family 4 protein [Peptoanaerobacter stomatis]|uniref:glycosyltransferase family 4 protein n=1 Tax=Peptoanaerobacter stomatis TaxID=796937 RepID=UPI003F9F0B26